MLRLRATVAGERLLLDFSGSAPRHSGNLNCPLAVTRSACYFAVRVLTDPDIPPSAGAYRPVEVRVPEGSLLDARAGGRRSGATPPRWPRATSRAPPASPTSCSRAFGRALGQGTMNNLTLGDERFSYYETLGGGQGACPDADGPCGVHVAMSNTLNTPDRGARARAPPARHALRPAPRLRRRRRTPRRRRGRARARGAARDDLLADHRAPPPPATRRPRRAARGVRAQYARGGWPEPRGRWPEPRGEWPEPRGG